MSRQNLPVISLCHLSDLPTSHLRCACHISTSQLIDRKQIHVLHQTRSLLLLLHSFGFWHWHTQYIGHWTRIETILTGQSDSIQATNWNVGPKDTLIKSSNCWIYIGILRNLQREQIVRHHTKTGVTVVCCPHVAVLRLYCPRHTPRIVWRTGTHGW